MTSSDPSGSIYVYQARQGSSCLKGVREPKIHWIDNPPDLDGGRLITVLPASQDRIFVEGAPEAPDWAWAAARNGQGKVVIDASREGWPHTAKRTRAIHRFLDSVGVPYDQAVYVTQDRGYGDAYDGYLRKQGPGSGMKVVVFDYWLREMARQFEQTGEAEFAARLAIYRARPRRRPLRFLSLNRTLRQTRALFVLSLLRDNLLDRGAVSIGGLKYLMHHPEFTAYDLDRKMFPLEEFEELTAELQPLLPRLAEVGEILFRSDNPNRKSPYVLEESLPQYHQTWFSVVTETEMLARPCRITEKALKPLLNFHPLLFFGNPGSLALLRAYGFETFDGFFDEAYDRKHDPRRRFEMAYREVRRLCALDEAELDRLEKQVEDIVVRNAWHALVELPKLFRQRLDPDLVDDILGPSPARPGPNPTSSAL